MVHNRGLMLAALACAVFVASGCAHRITACPGGQPASNRPVVLFWCPGPELLTNATHVTPQVWVEGDAVAKENYPGYSQDFWLSRGVTPLLYRGGYCYKDKSEEEFVRYWSGAAEKGYRGIAIDEFGSGDKEVDAKMGRALVRVREACPDLFIAVWHAGPFLAEHAGFYRDGADLVMVERYVSGTTGFEKGFERVVRVARKTGTIHKTVFALGIDDTVSAERLEKWGAWANSAEELDAQMRWIKTNAPEMPGIALYASHCSPEMREVADRLAGSHFRDTDK